MLIQDRIRLIMKSGNLSASDFASKIDVKPSNLSHVLSGRNKPSLDFLEKVINAYPNVNASWLITGETREGEFEGIEESTPKKETKTISNSNDSRELERIIMIYSDGTFESFTPSEQ